MGSCLSVCSYISVTRQCVHDGMATVILPLSILYIVSTHLDLFLNHSNPND